MPPVTLIKERETTQITYPEVKAPPQNWVGACPVVHTGRFRRGIPKPAQERIRQAIPVFGMTLRVYAPGTGQQDFLTRSRRRDPLVIGEKNGKFYLIAAWE